MTLLGTQLGHERHTPFARDNPIELKDLERRTDFPQSGGREKKGRERTLRAYFSGGAVQRFAPEPRGSLAFQPRTCARRAFDRVELAEGRNRKSNVLWLSFAHSPAGSHREGPYPPSGRTEGHIREICLDFRGSPDMLHIARPTLPPCALDPHGLRVNRSSA